MQLYGISDLCFINDICYGDGQTQVNTDCQVCRANISRSNWTLKIGYVFTVFFLDSLKVKNIVISNSLCVLYSIKTIFIIRK